MGQQKLATWIDEPAFIGSESLRTSVSRVVGDVASLEGDISDLSLSDSDSSQVGGEKVEEALSLFDHLSLQLTSSYRNLENKVSQLKNDLSVEEEQRREQLKEKEKLANRLSTLLEILPAGVVLLDENGIVSECNPAALDLLGEPLKGQAWVDVIKRSFSPKHDDGHEVSLKDGRRVKIETRSMSSGPGQLVLLSDLTETRLLQEKVSRTERLGSLGKMVASLAHQIRTPLSTAMLYTGHLCQTGLDESIRVGIAEKVMSRLTHLEHQIRDMLVFAKGDTRLAERLPLHEFLIGLRSAAEPVLANAGIDCEWDIAEYDADILCNKDSLVGACLNLINNSIEACEQQEKTSAEALRLKISLRLKASGKLALTIKDNGPGIPSNHRNKVFEPFYTTKPQGTGLGLAVVQAVIKAHQGSFNVRSSKNGVTALIELPCLESVNVSNEFAQG
jgi:two-component system, sensor histidine kinase FlrB